MGKKKRVTYPGRNGCPIEALYVIIDRQCTFTALGKRPSSINAVELITQAIHEAETDIVGVLDFFDLQTYLGYEGKEPGQYEYDQLIWGRPGASPQWHPIPLPAEVRRLFATEIG